MKTNLEKHLEFCDRFIDGSFNYMEFVVRSIFMNVEQEFSSELDIEYRNEKLNSILVEKNVLLEFTKKLNCDLKSQKELYGKQLEDVNIHNANVCDTFRVRLKNSLGRIYQL